MKQPCALTVTVIRDNVNAASAVSPWLPSVRVILRWGGGGGGGLFFVLFLFHKFPILTLILGIFVVFIFQFYPPREDGRMVCESVWKALNLSIWTPLSKSLIHPKVRGKLWNKTAKVRVDNNKINNIPILRTRCAFFCFCVLFLGFV